MQIKTMMKYYYTSRILTIPTAREDAEQVDLSCC